MKSYIDALGFFAVVAWVGVALNTGLGYSGKLNAAESGPGMLTTDQAAYYASLSRRVLEFRTQFDLLSVLAQEHKKRAAEAPGSQALRAQWERELAKELDDKAAAMLLLLNNASKDRLAFEQAHPDLSTSGLPSVSASTNAPNPDEIAFLTKLDERLVTVQQEVSDTIETGKLYQAQLLTNTSPDNFSRTSSLLQDNGNAVRRLQREISDLELMRLEFRALRREH